LQKVFAFPGITFLDESVRTIFALLNVLIIIIIIIIITAAAVVVIIIIII
jgi:hypothetical protein